MRAGDGGTAPRANSAIALMMARDRACHVVAPRGGVATLVSVVNRRSAINRLNLIGGLVTVIGVVIVMALITPASHGPAALASTAAVETVDATMPVNPRNVPRSHCH